MEIRTRKFGKLDDKGQYIEYQYNNFEYSNPIDEYKNIYIENTILFEREILLNKNFDVSKKEIMKVLLNRAISGWDEKLKNYQSIRIPSSLIKILETDKKKDQVKLLKGLSLTSNELISFVFKAYEFHGYTFSQYRGMHYNKGVDKTQMPEVIHIDEGVVNTIGETNMKDRQLKQIIEHRKVIISKFLDKDEKWHCFFLTFKSLGGKESYKNGQPHLHYISSAWNISREEVKKKLESKNYSLPSLPHIDYYTHRNPRRENN